MNSIGIVGGVGPYAGLDLNRKIFQLARHARSDQAYPRVFLLSLPQIPDRSTYLLNPETAEDPIPAITAGFSMLEKLDCTVCGIPCNTAHSPSILGKVLSATKAYRLQFVHMIRASIQRLQQLSLKSAGLLATMGTYMSQVYHQEAEPRAVQIIVPRAQAQRQMVHHSVYSLEFGIKAFSDPLKPKAIAILQSEGEQLIAQGARAIIAGCTEISLAVPMLHFSVPVIDPLQELAAALMMSAFPEKL